MRCREKTILPGQTLVLKNGVSSYWLPDGLEPGTRAILKQHSYGGMAVEVDGVEWHISDRCVEYELEYEVGNRWVPESDPRVLAYKAHWKARQSKPLHPA
jgi:hypothetical protein